MSETNAYPFSVPRRPSASRFVRRQILTLRESFAYVSSHLGISALVWAVVGVALALPGAVFLIRANLDALSSQWDTTPSARVFLKAGVTEVQTDALARQLAAVEGVSAATVVSPEQALGELGRYGGLGDALRDLPANPLPWAIVLTLEPSAESMMGELEARDEVDQVLFERDWVERLRAIRQLVDRTWWLLGALLGLGVLLVSAVAVRLALEDRLEEILILELVGASRMQVLTPFMYLGLWYGAVGGIAAILFLGFGLVALDGPIGRLTVLYGTHLQIAGFDPFFALLTVAVGGVLGVAGALAASAYRVRRLDFQ